jgi:hypothetical protein
MIEQAINTAKSIPGWCEPDELRWLAEQAAKHERIVEVGCWQGRSTKVMAAVTPGVIYAVDDFRGAGGAAADGWFGPDGFPLGINDTPHEELEARFRLNLEEEIKAGKVIVTGKSSPDAAEDFKPGDVDMCYIDGDHDTEPVREDLRAWRKILAKEGLLCGHDGPDPRVAEALRAEGIDYEIAVDNVWAA